MENTRQDLKFPLKTAEPQIDLATASLQLKSGQLKPGQIIGDRYEVKALIGQGGMGCVYLVEQMFLHKVFALKTLNPGDMSEVAWRRFQKEAQATSAFDHASLVKVHDFGMIDDSQPYFVMDYFEGETLASYIETTGALPLSDVLSIFTQVSFALAHAHKQGVVHRDIKPSNIMIAKVNSEYQVKVFDFGIAKLTSASEQEGHNLTRTGEVFGTPYYMSPEQCLGIAIDHRADVYSLGCVLFQALTGTPPFIGDTALSIMMQHQAAEPVSLQEASLGKTFPEAANRVIRKMMQKKPEDRYQSLIEVARDLDLIKQGQHVISQRNSALSGKPDHRLKILTAVTSILVLAGLSFVIGRSSAPNKDQFKRVEVPVKPLTDADLTNTKPATSPVFSGSKFYSELGDPTMTQTRSLRTFHFGEQSLPGIMVLPASVDCLTAEVKSDGAKKVFARGDVTINNFKPFTLIVSEDAADEPRLLKRFRSDEVDGLLMTSPDELIYKDAQLANITALKSVTHVKIETARDITDGCLRYLDQLPNLVTLSLSKTSVTGAGVGKMSDLKKFKSLDLSSLSSETGSSVLPALVGSTALETLVIHRSRVDDSCAESIAKLPNLRKLDVSTNGITGESLKKYQKLKHLEYLNIFDCDKISPESLQILATYPSLKLVSIGSTVEPTKFNAEIAKLKKQIGDRLVFRFMI